MKPHGKKRDPRNLKQWAFVAWAALVMLVCVWHLWAGKIAGIVGAR